MKRLLMAAVAVATVGLASLPASSMAATSVGVDINIGDPYRGAALHFRSEPDVILVPDTRVYHVRDYDYDVYRYGRYWYFIEDGRWYRARSYRGPFVYIHRASVPRAIVMVPAKYRRHWGGPPPHAVARGYHKKHDNHYVDRDRDRDRDRDHKHRGKAKGHGR